MVATRSSTRRQPYMDDADKENGRTESARPFKRAKTEIRPKQGIDEVDLPIPTLGLETNLVTNCGMVTTKSSSAKKAANGRGKLSQLINMPVDIFVEVASHLTPLDLLHMAQSSKRLRQNLMSKYSKPIWRTARNSLGMPDCPPDMSEPQYAHFIFTKNCFVCDKVTVQTIEYALRVRLCKRRFTISCLHTKKYVAFTSEPERNKFCIERNEAVAEIYTNGPKLERWHDEFQSRKRAADQLLAKNRQNDIKATLRDLGYTDEDLHIWYDRRWENLIDRPFELNPRIWKSILPKLEVIIVDWWEIRRKERISHLYREHLESLNCSREEKLLMPSFGDLILLPAIAELGHDDPPRMKFTAEQWETTLANVQDNIFDYKVDLKAACVAALRPARQMLPPDIGEEQRIGRRQIPVPESLGQPDTPLMRRATSFFQLNEPRQYRYRNLTYVELLSVQDYPAQHWSPASCASVKSLVGKKDKVSCDMKLVQIAELFLADLGLPKWTPMTLVESFGNGFSCYRCSPFIARKKTWKALVEHYLDELNFFEKSSETINKKTLKLVNDHDLNDIKPLCNVGGQDENNALVGDYYCALCSEAGIRKDIYVSLEVVTAHIMSKHDKEPEVEDIGQH